MPVRYPRRHSTDWNQKTRDSAGKHYAARERGRKSLVATAAILTMDLEVSEEGCIKEELKSALISKDEKVPSCRRGKRAVCGDGEMNAVGVGFGGGCKSKAGWDESQIGLAWLF